MYKSNDDSLVNQMQIYMSESIADSHISEFNADSHVRI